MPARPLPPPPDRDPSDSRLALPLPGSLGGGWEALGVGDGRAARILEYAPAGMLVVEAATLRVTFANRAARRLYQQMTGDEAPLLGQAIGELRPPFSERGVLAQVALVARSGEALQGLTLEHAGPPHLSGPSYWRFDIVPLGEPGTLAAELLLVVEDETAERLERQRAEHMAFSAQLYAEKLEAVIEQISEAVVIRDAAGRLVAYNRAALRLAKNRRAVERARLRGVRLEPQWKILSEDGAPVPEIELPSYRAIMKGAPVAGSQFVLRTEHGRKTPVLAHAAPLRDESGLITGAVIAFQDISAVKDLERLKDEFISVASHELRQPLTVIQGQAQMLDRHLRRALGPAPRPLNPHRLQELTDGITAQTNRLNLLVSDLLDMSRMQAGQLRLERARASLRALVTRVVEQQRTADPHHHFRLDVEAPAALRDLEGYWDSRRIEQILMNLLSNAVKYSPAGTEVRVRVSVLPEGYIPAQRQASRPRRVAGPAALVAISDEGIGMAEDALTRLFDRFYRAPNATGIPGTGLGLYICRQLAWAHQGDLWAESAGIERGSTFRLVLPLTGA